MRSGAKVLLAGLAVMMATDAFSQSQRMTLPASITAGSAFSVVTSASSKAALYIVGPGQVLRRDVQPGEKVSFSQGEVYAAGHYLVLLAEGSSTDTTEFDAIPAIKPVTLSLLARPSRLAVGLHNAISGAVYVFDAYHNLIIAPSQASLELSTSTSAPQVRNVMTRNGVAWTTMDSTTREGTAKLIARIGDVSSSGVIVEVPGDPCSLTISARPNGAKVEVQTAPVRDCGGNQIPDGTIVTFKETYDNMQSTVDVPIKRGIASISLPAHTGAKVSVASGVVAGNEIRLGGGQ